MLELIMKHDSRKHVVPEWKISKGRKLIPLPLSPPIEMSRKHLGLLFSDIFHAKRKRKLKLPQRTRNYTRTHEDIFYHVTHGMIPLIRPLVVRQNGGYLMVYRISKTYFSRGRTHAL